VPDFDWQSFRELSDANWRSWELICHGAVAGRYSGSGQLVALRAQPVVEFYLRLGSQGTDLGKAPRTWGWQCKWWDDAGPIKLSSARKATITKAFTNWRKYLPELTDWVLWTHKPLGSADWAWIEGAAPEGLTVHAWADADLDRLLAEAPSLRAAYFGGRVVTGAQLAEARLDSESTIRGLLPQLHVPTRQEKAVRALRADAESSRSLASRASAAASRANQFLISNSDDAWADIASKLAAAGATFSESASLIETYLAEGFTYKARESAAELEGEAERLSLLLESTQTLLSAEEADGRSAPAELTSVLGALRDANLGVRTVQQMLKVSLVAVVGEAGSGKSYLASQVACPSEGGPAGLLVPAKAFRGLSADLNRLAEFGGLPAMPIDDLLAALQATGERSGERIPLVIDGLHESTDAASWHDALARLRRKVDRLTNVVVVVTLRPAYRQLCLPEQTPELRLPGFQLNRHEAIRHYFSYYRIEVGPNAGGVTRFANAEQFAHPLLLRVFCETTNPTRNEVVTISAAPSSLVAALEAFVDAAVERIRVRYGYAPDAVRSRLRLLATAIWSAETRSVSVAEAKRILGDDPLKVEGSLALAFEDEGLLERDLIAGVEVLAPRFDALGGYLIADSLVLGPGAEASEQLKAALESLDANATRQYSEDVRRAVGHLLRLRASASLHELPIAPERIRTAAARDVASADPRVIGDSDAEALRTLIVSEQDIDGVWEAVTASRAIPNHPLNSVWLHATLSKLDIPTRDVIWSEWIRLGASDLLRQIELLTTGWRGGTQSREDRLHAVWLQWLLTTTDRAVRDRATEALYWYGRVYPAELFRQALASLDTNHDPYIAERLLAASAGVAMAWQTADPAWQPEFERFVSGLGVRLWGPAPTAPTAHWLQREYVLVVCRLASRSSTNCSSIDLPTEQSELPLPASTASAIDANDSRHDEIRWVLKSDFRNYTIGRLYDDRGNYDDEHTAYRDGVAEVLGRAWDLGWREARFGATDRIISSAGAANHDLEPSRVDRYGKKYSWIGFYELAGRRAAARALDNARISDVDIDPSFPDPPPAAPFKVKSWTRTRHKSHENWIRRGIVDFPDSILRRSSCAPDVSWLCLDGFLRDASTEDRTAFCFVWGVLVPSGNWEAFATGLSARSIGRGRLPEPAADYYTYAGEIPWAPGFASSLLFDGPHHAPNKEFELADGTMLPLRGVAHQYAWESYHSVTNAGVDATVPSRDLSDGLALVGRGQTFDEFSIDGQRASQTFGPPDGFADGTLLYLREDLLRKFAAERDLEFGWVVWGERHLTWERSSLPAWYTDAVQAGKNESQRVVPLT
jgi:hypothetical protein